MQSKKYRIEQYGIVTSTNDIAREKALAGAPEGTVILAHGQTAGRGRRGRQFVSPAGCGLYMSILLRPGTEENPLSITVRAAVAVARTIEIHTGRSAQIKWVNDIFQNGKKVCGILTEGKIDPDTHQLAYAILGIGINLLEPPGGYPAQLQQIAGAVFGDKETFDRMQIAEDIVQNYFDTSMDIYGEYTQRSLLTGRDVTVWQGSIPLFPATVLGIAPDFRLRVRHEDGREELLQTGEISVKAG